MFEARQIAHIRVGTGRGSIRISQAALDDYIASAAVAADPTAQKKAQTNED
jgi:hypothetical protein